MLFGYFGEPSPESSDVLKLEADIQSLHFDRPLHAGSELYYAGALAFAMSYGFGGLSIAEWAALDLAVEATPPASHPQIVELESELFDWLLTMVESQRVSLRD
jgi:hypothetical protein